MTAPALEGLRVYVTGGRDYRNRETVARALEHVRARKGVGLVCTGAAPGADALAGSWAKARGVCLVELPALWDFYGHAAGPIRNGWALELIHPDLVLAFPGGRGTRDAATQALQRGLLTYHVTDAGKWTRATLPEG